MENKYRKQSVEIVMNREEDLYKRICKVSEQTGESFESILGFVVIAGLNHHMDTNLKYLYEQRSKAIGAKSE